MKKLLCILGLMMSSAAQGATYYASASDSSIAPSGTACTVGAPCTFAYGNGTKVANGDTLLLYPGTYSDTSVTLSRDNYTVSAIPSVVSGAKYDKYGMIISGSDTRPFFSQIMVNQVGTPGMSISGSSVTLSYIRIKGLANCISTPGCAGYLTTNATTGVINISGEPATLHHNEVYAGGTIIKISAGRNILIQYNNLHSAGYYPFAYPFVDLPWYPNDATHSDPHIIAILTQGPIGTNYATGIIIEHNSLWEAVGNAVQEQSDCYGSPNTIFQFLTMRFNHMYNNHKQAWDAKGTQDITFHDNLVEYNDYGHIAINTPSDCSSNGPMDRWDVYNNIFRYSLNTVSVWSNDPNCHTHRWWNNIIYNNQTDAQYNGPAVWMCGDSNSTFYFNTMYNNGNFGTNQNGGITGCGTGSSNNIKNNIFYNNGTRTSPNDYGNIATGQFGCPADTGTPDHNYIVGKTQASGTNVSSTCYGAGNCPGFNDITANDYRLKSGSTSRDCATSTGMSSPYDVDYSGSTRPRTVGHWDCGAYRYRVLPPTGIH